MSFLRFFTRDWERGRDETAPARYLADVAAAFGEGSDVWRLATDVPLHDATLRRLDLGPRRLRLSVAAWDRTGAARPLDLVYDGPLAIATAGADLAALLRTAATVLRDEVEATADGHLCHRLALTDGRRLTITAAALRLRLPAPRSTRAAR